MTIEPEMLIQYGIAGLALIMMYYITNHRLSTIENLLQDIKDILLKE